MAKFALTVFQDEVRSPMPSPEEVPKVMASVAAHQEELKAAGVWVFFGALTAADSATVVESVNGELSMTDGPYIEAREQIGGRGSTVYGRTANMKRSANRWWECQ